MLEVVFFFQMGVFFKRKTVVFVLFCFFLSLIFYIKIDVFLHQIKRLRIYITSYTFTYVEFKFSTMMT